MYRMMVWHPPTVSLGESGINLFTISFLYTHCLSFLGELVTLNTHNTEVSICIEASYVVLASCVIEVCINIRADDVTTWLTVLRGELWPAVRDQAYELGSPQVRSCWAVTRKFPGAQNKVWHKNLQLSEAKKRSVCIR